MKNIKLTQTGLCCFILYLPVIFLVPSGVLAVLLCQDSAFPPFWLLASLILSLVYLMKNFAIIAATEILLMTLGYWKKDRLYYETNKNGKDAAEIEKNIIERIKNHGKTCTEYKVSSTKPLLVQFKRCYLFEVYYSSLEKNVILFKTDYLDEKLYRDMMTTSKQIVAQLKTKSKPSLFLTKSERKAPTARAYAVIILADRVDASIPSLIRKQKEFDETVILPCAVDLSIGRYYFDGYKDAYFSGKPVKNYAVDLITALLFKGRLPLKDNDAFDYSNVDREILDTTLFEWCKTFKEENKAEKKATLKAVKNMQDGEIQVTEDAVYIKKNEKTAEFIICSEEDERPVSLLSDGCWFYPNHTRISKKMYAEIKADVKKYYESQSIDVEFLDDED